MREAGIQSAGKRENVETFEYQRMAPRQSSIGVSFSHYIGKDLPSSVSFVIVLDIVDR